MMHEIDKTPTEATTGNALQQQLLQERSTQALADALSTAAQVEQTVVADITRSYFSHSDRNSSGIDLGVKDSSYTRSEKDMIDNAARRAGVPTLEGDDVGDLACVVWETQGVSLRMRFNDPAGALRQSLTETRSELNQPFEQMSKELKGGATRVVSSEPFTLGESGQDDIVFIFMDYGLSSKKSSYTRAKFVERLYALPVHLSGEPSEPHLSGEGVYFDEDGNLTKILREVPHNSGIYRGMYFAPDTQVDPTQTEFRLGIEIDTDRAIMEHSANNDILAAPFLTTDTGQALVEVIDLAGLTPGSKLSGVFTEKNKGLSDTYSKRYGGSYSELSREIAKYVNNPSRSLGTIFEGDEHQIRHAIELINVGAITNEPTRILIAMLQSSVTRSQEAMHNSDLPVFEGAIHMRDKSCKDAESYYLGSFEQQMYSVGEVGNKSMLHKHYGGETSINLEPVVYKGVEIPAGGLFQRHKDEQGNVSYAFVRMTSFALNEQDAADAFTWQYTEATRNRPGAKPTLGTLNTKLKQ